MDREEYLEHYGVKGMKWGVRHQRKKTSKTARKDAKEFARAKMYYGEGAGNRRKLIKATVNERSKNDNYYKKEFDKALGEQDMAKHATKAKHERARNTTAKTAAKTGRGLINAATGNIARASAAAVIIYAAAHYTGVDKKVAQYMKTKLSELGR